MHQTAAPAQQVAHRPQLRIVNVGLGQNLQPLQLRQVEGVVLVIGVLEAAVLLNLGRIGQVNRIAPGAQTVHQPIPVERRFDRHGLELRLERLEELATCFKSQSSFRCATRFPSWLITPIITLLLCRSIPAINLSLGLLMVFALLFH